MAKHAIAAYVGNREVLVRGLKWDRHGRTTADILLQADAMWGMSWSKKAWRGHDLIHPRAGALGTWKNWPGLSAKACSRSLIPYRRGSGN